MELIKTNLLTDSISALRLKKNDQELELAQQYKKTIESLKPMNMIYSAAKSLTNSDNIKDSLLNISMGLGVGLASKKIVQNNFKNILLNIVQSTVQFGISKIFKKK